MVDETFGGTLPMEHSMKLSMEHSMEGLPERPRTRRQVRCTGQAIDGALAQGAPSNVPLDAPPNVQLNVPHYACSKAGDTGAAKPALQTFPVGMRGSCNPSL